MERWFLGEGLSKQVTYSEDGMNVPGLVPYTMTPYSASLPTTAAFEEISPRSQGDDLGTHAAGLKLRFVAGTVPLYPTTEPCRRAAALASSRA